MCSHFPEIVPHLKCQEVLRIPEFRIKLLGQPVTSELVRLKQGDDSNCIPVSTGTRTLATPSKYNGANIVSDTYQRGRKTGRHLWEGIEEAQEFPFYFLSCETECLEDFAVPVCLVCQTAACRLSTSGVLFLTNYRLRFV